MNHDAYRALYIHIPFCAHRCAYCDFATRAVDKQSVEIDEYVESLVVSLRRYAREGELAAIKTVYLGGGTPSFIGMSRLSSLLYALSLSVDLTLEDRECTMEANPENLDERMVKDIWALGVNRLSLGVQSFDDNLLRMLGRIHDAERACWAITTALERFENVSIDLMCGIPGQSTEVFEASVQRAIDLGVTHISIYPLTIEPHTPLYNAMLAEKIDEPDDDVAADHMQLAARMLTQAGFVRYEVASYARPGYESKHNSAYWTGVPYLGIGMSATTMTQNAERRMRVCDGQVTDDLNRAQREAEDLMCGMRMARGISDERLVKADKYIPATPAFEKLEDTGLVEHVEGRWCPTEQGWLLGNELYGRLLDLAP